jgi:hypothetical protein
MGEGAAAAALMHDPSLLDAFRICGPRIGVPEVDAAREIAAGLLLDELRRLVRRLDKGFKADIRDEAVQVVLMRLFKAGPRGTRHGDPDSDASLRGYLVTALRNAARDLLPKPVFTEIDNQVESTVANPVLRPDHQLEELVRESNDRALVDATAARFRDVVHATAARLGNQAGSRLLATVAELTAIADGRLAFDRLVEAEIATGGTVVTVKNRFYKRYSRVLERLLETLAQMEEAGSLAPREKSALRAALDRLRLRPDGAR